jgi:hypothetical protein
MRDERAKLLDAHRGVGHIPEGELNGVGAHAKLHGG